MAPVSLSPARKRQKLATEEPPTVKLIQAIARENDFDSVAARAKANFLTITTTADEVLIRTAHESLRECDPVMKVTDHSGRCFWMVKIHDASKLRHTHAGGREIHVEPHSLSPKPGTWSVFPNGAMCRESPIDYRIDCRKFLNDSEIEILRNFFPGAVGAHVLVSGYIVILFPDRKAIQSCYELGLVAPIGGANIVFGLAAYVSTAVETGHGVTSAPDEVRSAACLGLRLRLRDGIECITTVTHAFVKTAQPGSSARRRISQWILAAKQALKSLRPRRQSELTSAVDSPIGAEVWLAGSSIRVGVINRTYDECPRTRGGLLPYPHGFTHDLCLVTGENLPQLTNPPGTLVITGWASHEEALRGGSLFLVCQNVATGVFRTFTGQAIETQIQSAIVDGHGYIWNKMAASPSRSLLWRTVDDHGAFSDGKFVYGASGAVLCLGRPTDREARVVVFQNFQGPLDYSLLPKAQQPMDELKWATYKGGFLVPQEIRQSEIRVSRHTPKQQFPTVSEEECCSDEIEKRVFTT